MDCNLKKTDIKKDPEYWKAVYNRIDIQRKKEPGLKWLKLAKDVKISSSVFSHMKKGKGVRVDTVNRIAKTLQVDAAVILSGENHDNEYYDFLMDASKLAANKEKSIFFKSIQASIKQAINDLK